MPDDPKPNNQPNLKVTTAQFAWMLDIDVRSVQLEIKAGFIPQDAPRAQLNLVDAMRGHNAYMKHLVHEATKRSADSDVSRARAREIEQRIAQRNRSLVALDECRAVVDEVIGTFRSEQDGLSAEFTRDMAERDRLEGLLNATYTRAGAKLAKAIAVIEAGGSLDDPPADDDAGSVGGEK